MPLAPYLTCYADQADPSPAAQDILFVDGLTESVDYHINALLKLAWPSTKKYLQTFDTRCPRNLAGSTFTLLTPLLPLTHFWSSIYAFS